MQRFQICRHEDVPLDTEGIMPRPNGAVPLRPAARWTTAAARRGGHDDLHADTPGTGSHRGPRRRTRAGSGRPLRRSRIPLAVVERRADRLRSGDARASRRCGPTGRARRRVLPLDRHQPLRIATEIDRLSLDPARLWIGIGSGPLRAQIDPLQRAVAELREILPRETRLVLAAMRPRLCRLAGAVADGVLLNWMLPDHVTEARRWVQEGADDAGRAAPIVASYVRVAVGSGSLKRLRDEERRYRNINEGHRRHFAAMNVPLGSVGVAAAAQPEVHARLAPYQSALDLPIVRVLADPDATSLTAVADAAAPLNDLARDSPPCRPSRP